MERLHTQPLSEQVTTKGKSLATAALPPRYGNKKDSAGWLQPECTAQPSLYFLSKDNGNLVVPVF